MTVMWAERKRSRIIGVWAFGVLVGATIGVWIANLIWILAPVEPLPEPEKYELDCLTMPVENPYVRCK